MEIQSLIICPLKKEWQLTERALQQLKMETQRHQSQGRWIIEIPAWKAALCVGGHGKAQFARQSQSWLSKFSSTQKIICIGSAGALTPLYQPGDVVSVTEIVEHNHKGDDSEMVSAPRFLTANKGWACGSSLFTVHCGILASVDEDIVDPDRASQLANQTGAQAVAWESAGGAHTAHVHKIPYFEFRGITDMAGTTAPQDFTDNLETAMIHVSHVLKNFFA